MPDASGKRRNDIALRPQPARDGADFWPTPACLREACVRFVVPLLPPGPIWECAAGDGCLAAAIGKTGRQTFTTDLYPQDGSAPCDFLTTGRKPDGTGDVSNGVGSVSVVTNPPNNRADAFIKRSLELLDQKAIAGAALLLRHDYLQAGSRAAAFNRTTIEIRCNWRPIWVEGTSGQPRWSFHWIIWMKGPRWAPLYLQLAQVTPSQPTTKKGD
jgi:hypothetical protein